MSKVIHSYINNNYTVKLFADGTKIRYYDKIPQPVYPESIDIKITDYCNMGCSYCHEKSTRAGKHGNLKKLLLLLKELPKGIEIAIGGGNPLDHPDLHVFVKKMRDHGLVPNITINEGHLKKQKAQLIDLIDNGLIFGTGISRNRQKNDIESILDVYNSNTVIHFILGVDDIQDIEYFIKILSPRLLKILVLGYKNYGRGVNFYLHGIDKIETNLKKWYIYLPQYLKDKRMILSLDTLAIKQLNLQRFLSADAWDLFYMGDDGQYTMYIDAVEYSYSISSTSDNRNSIGNKSIIEIFSDVRKKMFKL